MIKQRRVGTFTLGITLILIGIMVPLILIFKDKAILLLQFAPIVLVFLGVEVLIYAIKFKEDKLRYDGVSIFLVIMLTVVSVGTASIAPIVSRAVTNERMFQQHSDEAEDIIDEAIFKNGLDGSASLYCQGHYGVLDYYTKIDETKLTGNIRIYDIEEGEKPEVKNEVVEKVTSIVKDMNDADLNLSDIKIMVYRGSDYSISRINLNSYQIENINKEFVKKHMSWYNEYEKELETNSTTSNNN